VKAWILPSGLVVLVGMAVLGAGFSPAAPLPPEPIRESNTRVSVVCPAFESATASVRIAAIGTDQAVRTSKVGSPQKTTESKGLALVTNPGQPVRVSVQRSEMFGATTVASAADGPARGLAATSCLSPQAEHWFTGVDASTQAQADLVLVNLDATNALVDLVAYGPGGRISAPRGLTVEGNSASTVSLGVLARSNGPITLKVSTSQGRVAAFVRQVTWNQNLAFGADWVPAGLGPQTDQVLPGIPAGKGRRTLVVTNPSDRTADVQIDVLSASGVSQLTDAQRVQVAPGVTATVDLEPGLAGMAAGLRLTSNLGVSAGVVTDNGLPTASLDGAVIGAAPPVPADAVWPIALGTGTAGVLQLVNPSDQEVSVKVAVTVGAGGAVKTSEVKVAPGSSLQVPLPKAAVETIRIQTASTLVRGSVIATASLGRVKGLAVLDLVADETRIHQAVIVFDPHLS
jgi:P pilus assembly chaperone PapD